MINSRRDSYSSAGCLVTKRKEKDQGRNPVIRIAGHDPKERKKRKGKGQLKQLLSKLSLLTPTHIQADQRRKEDEEDIRNKKK